MVDEICEPMFHGTRAEVWTDDQKKTFWTQAEILFGLPVMVVTNDDCLNVLRSLPFVGEMSMSTFERVVRKRYECSIGEYRKRHQGTLKARIFSKQVQVALGKGNPVMLKWLGMNMLGQSDKMQNVGDDRPSQLIINIGEIKNDPLVTSSENSGTSDPSDATHEPRDNEGTSGT